MGVIINWKGRDREWKKEGERERERKEEGKREPVEIDMNEKIEWYGEGLLFQSWRAGDSPCSNLIS